MKMLSKITIFCATIISTLKFQLKEKGETMSKKIIILTIVFILVCSTGFVYAGSINNNEARIVKAASGTFKYKGKTYISTEASLNTLRAYLNRSDIDLTAEQADKAISMMYAKVEEGVLQGHIVEVGQNDTQTPSNNGEHYNPIVKPIMTENRDIIKEVFERSQVINNSSVDTVLNSSLGFLELIDKTNKTVFKIDTPIKNTGYSQSSLFIVAVVFMLVLIGNIAVIIRFKLYRKDYE